MINARPCHQVSAGVQRLARTPHTEQTAFQYASETGVRPRHLHAAEMCKKEKKSTVRVESRDD